MTINGKGILPPDHPLRAFRQSRHGAAPRANWPQPTWCWRSARSSARRRCIPSRIRSRIAGRLIHIDIDPLQLVTQFPAALPIVADAKLAVAALLAALPAGTPTAAGRREREAIRAAVDEVLWPACATHRRIMEIVDEVLAGRHRCGRPDRAGLLRQPVLPGGAAALLFQLQHRLRHAGLRAAGGVRRKARRAGSAGRVA